MKRLGLRVGIQKVGLSTIQLGSWHTSDQTASNRGYGYRWQQARLGHLRHNPLCVMCEAEGKVTAATIVDHRDPHRGDQAKFWDRSNWQSLCSHHHASHKQKIESGAVV